MLRGIDVSAVQGDIDWASVAASGVSYAIVKVAEGDTYRDPFAARNLSKARAAGLVVGAYCFARPSAASDPAAQARAHYGAVQAAVGGLWGDLPNAIDLEASGGLSSKDLAAWLEAHVAEMARLLGCSPLLYTFPSFWAPLAGLAGPATAATALWWASYGKDVATAPADFRPFNPVPKPWGACRFWQYSDRGQMRNGTHVDTDLFAGSLDELRAMTLSASTSGFKPSLVPPDPSHDPIPDEVA